MLWFVAFAGELRVRQMHADFAEGRQLLGLPYVQQFYKYQRVIFYLSDLSFPRLHFVLAQHHSQGLFSFHILESISLIIRLSNYYCF